MSYRTDADRSACNGAAHHPMRDDGRVAEWFKAPVLKTGRGATLSWVRIPPLPPLSIDLAQIFVRRGAEPARPDDADTIDRGRQLSTIQNQIIDRALGSASPISNAYG